MTDHRPLDNRALARATLLTVGAMLGAVLVVVGSLTLLARSIAYHAVAPTEAEGEGELVPAANVHGVVAGSPGAPRASAMGARPRVPTTR